MNSVLPTSKKKDQTFPRNNNLTASFASESQLCLPSKPPLQKVQDLTFSTPKIDSGVKETRTIPRPSSTSQPYQHRNRPVSHIGRHLETPA